jgi:hypothetical protein
VSNELSLIRQGFTDRVARARRIMARATALPLAVRAAIFVSALLAQAFAYPVQVLTGSSAILVIVLAALPALWPRTAAVTVTWVVIVTGWVLTSTLYAGVASLARLLGLTVCLYLVHTGAALAAVLPYDAVVEPSVVARWVLRAAFVIAVAGGASVAALSWVGRVQPRTFQVSTVVGLALTVLIGWLLTLAVRRH